jgi:hypothetical protein
MNDASNDIIGSVNGKIMQLPGSWEGLLYLKHILYVLIFKLPDYLFQSKSNTLFLKRKLYS